jgi:hypothetical protein
MIRRRQSRALSAVCSAGSLEVNIARSFSLLGNSLVESSVSTACSYGNMVHKNDTPSLSGERQQRGDSPWIIQIHSDQPCVGLKETWKMLE